MSAAQAVKDAAIRLHLEDVGRLRTALLVAAADQLAREPDFASRVQHLYTSLPTSTKSAKLKTPKALSIELVPIKYVAGFQLNPAVPIDPYLVLEAYGAHQLRTVLDIFSLEMLKESAALVERRNPGTKPTNRRSKAALIAYIERIVPAQG